MHAAADVVCVAVVIINSLHELKSGEAIVDWFNLIDLNFRCIF